MKKKLLFIFLLVVSFYGLKVNAKGYIGHTVHFRDNYEKRYVTDTEKAHIMEKFGLASWDGSVIVGEYHDGEENTVTFSIDYSNTNLGTMFPMADPDNYGIDEEFLSGYQCVPMVQNEPVMNSLFNFMRGANNKLQFGMSLSITQDELVCSASGDFYNNYENYKLYRFEEEGLSLLMVDGDENAASYIVFYEAGDNTSGVINFKNGSETVNSMEATAIRDYRSNIYTISRSIQTSNTLPVGYLSNDDANSVRQNLGLSMYTTGYDYIKLIPTDGLEMAINRDASTIVDEDIAYIASNYGYFTRENGTLFLKATDFGEVFTSIPELSIFGTRYAMDSDTGEFKDTGLSALDPVTIYSPDVAMLDFSYDDGGEFVEQYLPANFVMVSYYLMNGTTQSFIYTYDTEENRALFNFDHVSDSVDPYTGEYSTKVVDIEEKRFISTNEMRALVQANQHAPVEIRAADGVVFTFGTGTMSLVNGMEDYDFGVSINRDYTTANVSDIAQNTFLGKVHYDYSGNLPGTAEIKIFVGNGYTNKKVKYGEYNNGIVDPVEYVVDGNGYFTATQDHCSDYVFVLSDDNPDDPIDPPGPTIVRGDFNGDGNVNFNDVVTGLRKVFGYMDKTENDTLLGDLNNNGALEFSDIIVLLRFVFGYIDTI